MDVIKFEGSSDDVKWCGTSLTDGEAFQGFLSGDVSARLNDDEGTNDLTMHLRGLAGTGFASDNLEEILSAEILEEREWAIGEAIAETWLSRTHGVIWPWNMERDKRTPMASLPGADLVGFVYQHDQIYLALGEVKTSSDINVPPNVMYGRSGMTYQLEKIASNLALLFQLIKWLWPRCRGTEYEAEFNAAIQLLLNSGNKAICLFGVLIRDTSPAEGDVQSRAISLSKVIASPTECTLLGLYLPCAISEIPVRIVDEEQV